MRTGDDEPRFEDVEWSEIDRSWRIATAERLTFFAGLVILSALYVYNREFVHVYLIFDWWLKPIDWVFLLAVVIVTAFGIVPLLKRRERVATILRRLRSKPVVMVAGLYLAAVTFFGILGPALGFGPSHQWQYWYNPPLGFESNVIRDCAGTLEIDTLDRICHGSTEFPLGTNRRGEGVDDLVIAGARPAVYVMLIGGVMVVPLATTVGVIAGLRGGLIDKLLMSYVDLQLSLPAVMIYFIAFMYYGASLLVLLVAFAMFSWGGIARLVRSEVIQVRERGHVTVARSLGASHRYLAVRHIVPNITNTLIPAICQFLALLILYEAGVAFLGFYEAELRSWGSVISESVNAEVGGLMHSRPDEAATDIWWVSTFPAIALTLTMVSFKILGDGLRDVLDPRGER